jgi:hypothetical protein
MGSRVLNLSTLEVALDRVRGEEWPACFRLRWLRWGGGGWGGGGDGGGGGMGGEGDGVARGGSAGSSIYVEYGEGEEGGGSAFERGKARCQYN